MLVAIQLLGGLGLFISGMSLMSRGIEKVAGNRLRNILATFTKTKFLGLIVGMFFTAVIQSSSAATVMVVNFVNSGLMTLTEACGIILGANIGTTITALLVAFKLSLVAPVFVFFGAVMVNFVKTPKIRKTGEIVLGFGLLFVGISTMSAAMAVLRENPDVIDFLAGFTNPVLGVLLGLIVTSVVQSSSVTVSILVVMGSQGLVDLGVCMYVILGCNIGSCTSALLSSVNGSKNAKRAALIHMLFNIFGSIVICAVLAFASPQIEGFIRGISGAGNDPGSLGRNIAFTHIVFKVFQVVTFYPLMDYIVKLTYIFIPETDDEETEKEQAFHLQFISHTLPNPAVATYLAVQEMERMANMAIANLNKATDAFEKCDDEPLQEINDAERYIDYFDKEISDYLVKINQNTLPLADANLIAAYFHVVSDIERIGDHAVDIANFVPQIKEMGVKLTSESVGELKTMMGLVNQILEESLEMFVTGKEDNMESIKEIEDKIDRMERNLQKKHIHRLNDGKCSALTGIYFSDVVSGLERVADHAINIAFSLVEAKENK